MSIKDMVKDGKKVFFVCFKENALWYKTECGFEFPIPISEAAGGVYLPEDKALLFMRFIRKHLKMIEEARKPGYDKETVDFISKHLL